MDLKTLQDYQGKKGTLQIDETGDNVEEVVGTLVGVTPVAAIVHTKSGGSRLLKHDAIVSFEPEPEKKKEFKPKRLDPIEIDETKLRSHLLDRHGVLYADVENLDTSALRSMHDKLHNAGTLGHVHETKEASKNRSRAAEAAAQAEAGS